MGIPQDLRTRAIAAMRLVKDSLGARTTSPAEEAEHVREAVAAACTSVGITPHDYVLAVDAEVELSELERETLGEALAGPTDPGPHDEISRESPSGQPGDLRKNRTHPIPR